jgi:hypothetical protein
MFEIIATMADDPDRYRSGLTTKHWPICALVDVLCSHQISHHKIGLAPFRVPRFVEVFPIFAFLRVDDVHDNGSNPIHPKENHVPAWHC